jgi:hypothetical protein
MRKLLIGIAFVLALLSLPHVGRAQVSGVAFVSLTGDVLLDNGTVFLGPWRVTENGIDIRYWAACIDTADQNRKIAAQIVVAVPNGSQLADIRTLSTTAVVDFCAGGNITVPRAAVFLPQFAQGQ